MVTFSRCVRFVLIDKLYTDLIVYKYRQILLWSCFAVGFFLAPLSFVANFNDPPLLNFDDVHEHNACCQNIVHIFTCLFKSVHYMPCDSQVWRYYNYHMLSWPVKMIIQSQRRGWVSLQSIPHAFEDKHFQLSVSLKFVWHCVDTYVMARGSQSTWKTPGLLAKYTGQWKISTEIVFLTSSNKQK